MIACEADRGVQPAKQRGRAACEAKGACSLRSRRERKAWGGNPRNNVLRKFEPTKWATESLRMRLPFKYFTIAVALVCISPGAARSLLHAQTSEKPRDISPSQLQLFKRIIDVLNSTAAEAAKWDDKQVAARTQAQIADLIWDANPDNAKNYLKAAWTAAAKVEEPNRDRSPVVNPSVRNKVRRDVLLVARKRAPELAVKWLDEMVEEKSAEKTNRGVFDDQTPRSAVLLQMAYELVADNSEAAAELLIASLNDGISFNFQHVLIQVQKKNPTLSEKIFRAALTRLRTVGMSDPNELLTLYAYLYSPGRVFAANTSDNRDRVQLALGGGGVSTPAGRQNPAMAREFLEVASDLLLSTPLPVGNNAQSAARSLVSVIGIFLNKVTPELPEKAALLRARAQQLDSQAAFSNVPVERSRDVPDVRPGESKESFTERRVDLLEEMAAKGRDVLTRDIGYGTAAVATNVERYERGLNLAGKIEDKTLRDGVGSWLIFRAVLHFISSANLDEAYRLNLKNEDAAQRAVALVVGAQKLVEDKDTTRASEWLREAGAILKRSDATDEMSRIALGMVSTYGRIDQQSSVEWLLFAVKLMRKTPAASLNDDKAPAVKRISGITPITDLTYKTSGFSLQSAVAMFPSDQFEQVLSLLNDMTPPEARGIAVVTLCSTFLKSVPNASKKLSH